MPSGEIKDRIELAIENRELFGESLSQDQTFRKARKVLFGRAKKLHMNSPRLAVRPDVQSLVSGGRLSEHELLKGRSEVIPATIVYVLDNKTVLEDWVVVRNASHGT